MAPTAVPGGTKVPSEQGAPSVRGGVGGHGALDPDSTSDGGGGPPVEEAPSGGGGPSVDVEGGGGSRAARGRASAHGRGEEGGVARGGAVCGRRLRGRGRGFGSLLLPAYILGTYPVFEAAISRMPCLIKKLKKQPK